MTLREFAIGLRALADITDQGDDGVLPFTITQNVVLRIPLRNLKRVYAALANWSGGFRRARNQRHHYVPRRVQLQLGFD